MHNISNQRAVLNVESFLGTNNLIMDQILAELSIPLALFSFPLYRSFINIYDIYYALIVI